MTRESLEAKLKDLRQQALQAQANLNAILGAIQFAEQLLAEVNALEAARATLPPKD